MLRNHQSWYDFATTAGIGLDPQDIILVRGTIKSSSWAVAAFFDAGKHVHEVSFNGQFGNVASIGVDYAQQQETFCSFEHRVGPHEPTHRHNDSSLAVDSERQDADQCVFMSYFKVKYRKFLWKKIVANAESSEPPRR